MIRTRGGKSAFRQRAAVSAIARTAPIASQSMTERFVSQQNDYFANVIADATLPIEGALGGSDSSAC
ncbi:MAG: hypothetical protein NVS1B2_12820 [Vulcanimicrobiaceae bacterium]